MRVRAYPHPPGTEPADLPVQSTVGLLSGNGNHCDYLVRVPLLTKLPDAEIVRYYNAASVEGVEGRPLSGNVYIDPNESYRKGYRNVIVEFFDGYHDPGWDPRCH